MTKMQTVTADAINSGNKQKNTQLQTNSSRKFQENEVEEKVLQSKILFATLQYTL